MFAAVRSARLTFWMALAIFGYYLIVSDIMRRNGADTTDVWLIFLAMLLLYGLWTRAPVVAIGAIGGITFLWIVGALLRPGVTLDVDAARLGWTMYHALAPPLAVGLGTLARATLFRRPSPAADAPVVPR